MTIVRQLIALFAGLTAIFLVGCNREIVRNQLTEDQANEISVALFSMKLTPTKEKRDKDWQVSIPKEDYAFALAILQQQGLPRSRYQSAICDQFKKDGMIASGMEDRGRLMCSQSHDLEMGFRSMEGVVTAHVGVNIPARDPISDKVEQPRAWAMIKTKPNARIERDAISNTIRDSLSGLDPKNVSVMLSELQPLSRADFQSQGGGGMLSQNLSLVLGAFGVFAILAGAFVWWQRRKQQPSKIALPVTIPSGRGT